MGKSKLTLSMILVGFALVLGLPLKVGAVDFSGKSVTLSIAFSVGGGSDRWARVYAPYLSKYLPGNPTVVVRNMPGGGGITGVNRFVARAKPNGRDILGTSGSNQIPYLLGDRKVKYDYKDLQIILGSPVGGEITLAECVGFGRRGIHLRCGDLLDHDAPLARWTHSGVE